MISGVARRQARQRARRQCGGAPDERGSVLMLVPAGFLVLIILAALAVDSAAAYLGQQELHDALEAAANDAVTSGLSNPAFYSRGTIAIDPDVAARSICLDIAAQSVQNLHGIQVWMAVDGATLSVRATATVDAVFGQVIPRFGQRQVRAEAEAVVTGHALASNGSTLPSAPMTPLSCH
jgi:Flp pilus assembly protein TadG